jgi:CRISPR/Cas system-associated exonuclease Cas4 (RecB family)
MLENILSAFAIASVASLSSAGAVEALKRLGGYSELARSAIAERLAPVAGNPREVSRIDYLRTELVARIPEMRQRVQLLLSRTKLQPHGTATHDSSPEERVALGPGSYPEAELRAADLRFAGRIDLLTITEAACEITDYKTGAPDEHHQQQLLTYALLWNHDGERNPGRLPIRRLTLAYPSTNIETPVPTEDVEIALAADLADRIAQAEAAISRRPPPTKPDPEICRLCSVRHLCEDYWSSVNNVAFRSIDVAGPSWFDYEGTVISQNGPRSWLLCDTDGGELLVRTIATQALPIGEQVKILGLLRGHDAESKTPIASINQNSEIFILTSGS